LAAASYRTNFESHLHLMES